MHKIQKRSFQSFMIKLNRTRVFDKCFYANSETKSGNVLYSSAIFHKVWAEKKSQSELCLAFFIAAYFDTWKKQTWNKTEDYF